VAQEFVTLGSSKLVFDVFANALVRPLLDVKRYFDVEVPTETDLVQIQEFKIIDVLFGGKYFNQRDQDFAFFKLKPNAAPLLPIPLDLDLSTKKFSELIVVHVGYPAVDSQASAKEAEKVFSAFDVKTVMPGKITKRDATHGMFSHDCSTLPGTSGSPIIDRSTGKALSIHYGKQAWTENFAISAQKISEVLNTIPN
jgi:hypothetical protein